MPLIYINKLCEDDVFLNPDAIFLFAENDAEKGGSPIVRELRGLDNTVGVRVKRSPTTHPSSYFPEDDYTEATMNIDNDLRPVEDHLADGGVVVVTVAMFSDEKLKENSPDIYDYMQDKLNDLRKS